jgi:hypothetical protein
MAACDLSDGGFASSGCGLKLPPPGEVLSPYVKATFFKGGTSITVGNQSSPSNDNHAVIKDFEWGFSDGHECRVTILDDKGGSFVQFMEDIVKDWKEITGGAYHMTIEFGWITASCGGGGGFDNSQTQYLFMCDNIECSFAGGRFMFVVTGTDIGPRIFEGRFEQVIGTDAKPVPLTTAIKQMFTDDRYPPTINNIQFLRRTDGGGTEPIRWKDTGDTAGPLGKWSGDGLDKLNCARSWLRSYLTTNDKTVIPVFVNESNTSAGIIFWEDFKPKCNESRDFESSCIGTFIVNGGAKSPVIEFNPKIRWDFSYHMNTAGDMGTGKVVLNKDGKPLGLSDCASLSRASLKTSGSTTTVPVNDNKFNAEGKDASDNTAKAVAEQLRSWKLFTDPIEADLVVIGDPNTVRPRDAAFPGGSSMKIVFLNPYSIFSGDGCGEWLAEPTCNPVLTNDAWLIKSVTHRIADGKFTTTYGIFLDTPGEDYDIGSPLGGPGANGFVPS